MNWRRLPQVNDEQWNPAVDWTINPYELSDPANPNPEERLDAGIVVDQLLQRLVASEKPNPERLIRIVRKHLEGYTFEEIGAQEKEETGTRITGGRTQQLYHTAIFALRSEYAVLRNPLPTLSPNEEVILGALEPLDPELQRALREKSNIEELIAADMRMPRERVKQRITRGISCRRASRAKDVPRGNSRTAYAPPEIKETPALTHNPTWRNRLQEYAGAVAKRVGVGLGIAILATVSHHGPQILGPKDHPFFDLLNAARESVYVESNERLLYRTMVIDRTILREPTRNNSSTATRVHLRFTDFFPPGPSEGDRVQGQVIELTPDYNGKLHGGSMRRYDTLITGGGVDDQAVPLRTDLPDYKVIKQALTSRVVSPNEA